MRLLWYALFGLCGLVLQTAIFPRLLPFNSKPGLLLILVVYLGLCEKKINGAVLAYAFGLLFDVFSGIETGRYGLLFLVLYFSVRSTIGFFNPENPFLLLFLVGCGTLIEAGSLIFLDTFFASGNLWQIVLRGLVPQLLLNIFCAGLLMLLVTWLQRRFPRLYVPGMQRLDERYES